MRFADPLKKIFVVLMVLFLSIPLPLVAQDDKKPDEKKDEKKPETLPLKMDSVIKFTTDEGTWMSLDVSPDGQTIVFDLLGDVYTLPIGGGEAKRIIGGMSFESQPVFSPDGKSIVFLSDRSGTENVWVCKADGSEPKAITKDKKTMYVSPSWTADGNYIIVSKSEQSIGTFHAYIYHKDGGSGLSIGPAPPPLPGPDQQGPPPAPRVNRMGAVASPDGRYIYYAQRTGAFEYNARFPMWQIFRFDRETSEVSRITNTQGSAIRPVISPDGKNLTYATRFETKTALRVRNLETSQERWLVNNVTRDDQESRATRDAFPGYDFLPDGKSLIVPIGGKIKRIDFATGQATDVPFTANVEAEIGPRVHFDYRVDDSAMVTARLIRYPVLSPDGKRAAFTAFDKLYVIDLPSGKPRRLTTGTQGEFMPSWSPDGSSIVYVTWSNQGGHIQSVPSAGGPPRQLTTSAAFYSSPVYSPDGSKVVFITGAVDDQLFADIREGHEFSSPEEEILHGHEAKEITGMGSSTGLDLRYIPAGGGSSTLIAPTQGGRFPHFTEDQNRVFLTTNQGLVSVRLDGYDRRTHLKITGKGSPPNFPNAGVIKVSPDGTRAFAELQGQHFLVTVPKVGKETVNVSLAGPTSSVPFKKMSVLGGDFLNWSGDGKTVSWSWGTTLFRQDISADKPESFEIKVESPRNKPKGTAVLSGARIITMRGDEIIENGDLVITDNRITAIGSKRQGAYTGRS